MNLYNVSYEQVYVPCDYVKDQPQTHRSIMASNNIRLSIILLSPLIAYIGHWHYDVFS